MSQDRKIEKHPSYAIASFSRITGGDGKFFGTTVNPDHYIVLKIAVGEKEIDWTGKERFYSDHSSIIEVKMTNNQFAELITTMNTGNGTPCTMYRLQGKGIESAPAQSSKVMNVIENANNKMQEQNEKLVQELNVIRDILENKKAISQADRETIKKALFSVDARIKDGGEFYSKKINDIGEIVKQEIRTEIDAMTTATVMGIGLNTIKNLAIEGKKE